MADFIFKSNGKFDVIYADPPWRYRHCKASNRKIENHYPTMTREELLRMGKKLPASNNCVLFLWATAPKLAEAIELIEVWGFDYRTCAVWDKDQTGLGYWFRIRHELLLVAVRGKMSPPNATDRLSSVFRIKAKMHSEKPVWIRRYIERAFPDAGKLEIFGRVKRKGWTVEGNQVEDPQDFGLFPE